MPNLQKGCNATVHCAKFQLSDFPNDRLFMDSLPNQYAEFISRLPFGQYTLPYESKNFLKKAEELHIDTFDSAPLNLCRHLSSKSVPPDLGPRMYAANGSLRPCS